MANASLTISFNTLTASTDQFIDLELDDVQNELINEKTSGFIFGETVYFKMFTNCSDVTFITTLSPDNITSRTGGDDDIKEYITFLQPAGVGLGGKVADQTASLSKPVKSGTFSSTLKGGSSVGSIIINDSDPKTAKGSILNIAVYEATYKSTYTGHSIVGPSEPGGWVSVDADGENVVAFPVVIVAVGV